MPYGIYKVGGKHCVYKKNAAGRRTGKSLGCHRSKSRARAQRTAIILNERSSDMGETAAVETVDLQEALSYGEIASDTIEAFKRQFPRPDEDDRFGEWLWQHRVYDEFITVRWKGKHWKVPYINETGPGADAEFADVEDWTPVEYQPVEVASSMAAEERLEEALRLDRVRNPYIVDAFFEAESNIEVVDLIEADGGKRYIDFRIIRPGFGNSRDGFYYPADVIERDAGVFVGAKMYEIEHKEKDRSNRTWVSTCVEAGERFDGDGGAIGRALVHDPDFWERAVRLKDGGLLDKLQNSIVARGTWRPGSAEGRKARVVESITEGKYIDWVNQAGAGGAAIDLFMESVREGRIEGLTLDTLRELRPDLVYEILHHDRTRLLTEVGTAFTQRLSVTPPVADSSTEQPKPTQRDTEDSHMGENTELQEKNTALQEELDASKAETVAARRETAQSVIAEADLPGPVRTKVEARLSSIDFAETDWRKDLDALVEAEKGYYNDIIATAKGAGKAADLGESQDDNPDTPQPGGGEAKPALTDEQYEERWTTLLERA